MHQPANPPGAFDVTHRMVLGLALPMTFGFLTARHLMATAPATADA